jgi:hypothetical protein
MIEQVLQRRWDAVVVLAADDHEAVGRANDIRQLRQRIGSRACRVLLVHPVQERQPVFERIDEADLMSAGGELRVQESRVLDPLPLAADRSIEHRKMQAHEVSSLSRLSCRPDVVSRSGSADDTARRISTIGQTALAIARRRRALAWKSAAR